MPKQTRHWARLVWKKCPVSTVLPYKLKLYKVMNECLMHISYRPHIHNFKLVVSWTKEECKIFKLVTRSHLSAEAIKFRWEHQSQTIHHFKRHYKCSEFDVILEKISLALLEVAEVKGGYWVKKCKIKCFFYCRIHTFCPSGLHWPQQPWKEPSHIFPKFNKSNHWLRQKMIYDLNLMA